MASIESAGGIDRRVVLSGIAGVLALLVLLVAFWSNRGDSLDPTADAARTSTTRPVDATSTAGTTTAAPRSAVSTTTSSSTTFPATSTSISTTTSSSTTTTSSSTTTTTTIDPADLLPTLVEGDEGIEVAVLQRMLRIVTGADVAADGVYGPATAEAVRAFQRFVDLPETGDADHHTRMVLMFVDAGRSTLMPSWPLPTIGDGGADGCQVAVVADSLVVGRERLHRDRLAEIGCASAVDAVGGRSLAFGWQCRVIQPSGSRPLLLLPEAEPGNQSCAPSGLELLELWADARALGDVLVVALGTNDAGLFSEQRWIEHWEQAFAFAGHRPVILVTTQARPGSTRVAGQGTYSDAARRWCATRPGCVLADWALAPAAIDAASYVDSVHLTASGADARASFIRDVIDALLSGRPIPNPAPLPTPTTIAPATTTTAPPATTSTTPSTTTSVPDSTSTTSTTAATSSTTSTTTSIVPTTSTTSTSSSTSTSTTVAAGPTGP